MVISSTFSAGKLPTSPLHEEVALVDPDTTGDKVMDLLFLLSDLTHAKAHSECKALLRKKIFSHLHNALKAHKDTLRERCFMLGVCILDNIDVSSRLHCPSLTETFFNEWTSLEKKHPGTICKVEQYHGLFQEKEWYALLDAMDEGLGSIRPTELLSLLTVPSLESAVFRTLLHMDKNALELRLWTHEDCEIWNDLCSREECRPYLKKIRLETPSLLLLQEFQNEQAEKISTFLSICSHNDPILQKGADALGQFPSLQSNSETVFALIETMSKAHHEDRKKIFSRLHAALSAHKDTLQERCFLLALCIFDGIDLNYRLRFANLNAIFLLNYNFLKSSYPDAMKREEVYLGLFQKEELPDLLDAMEIYDTDVPKCGCLGPIRPSEAQTLLFTPGMANCAFRTLLSIEKKGLELHIRTQDDFKIWKESSFAFLRGKQIVEKIEVDTSLYDSFILAHKALAISSTIVRTTPVDKLAPGYKGYPRR